MGASYHVTQFYKLLFEKIPMVDEKDRDQARVFADRSSLYREFLQEREEILKHKWLESEKAGRDIGFERALLDWIRNHRDRWKASRRAGQTEVPTSQS